MEEIKRKRGRPVGSKNRPKNAPLTYETPEVVQLTFDDDKPPIIGYYDKRRTGHAGDGNFRPRIEGASTGTRNTDVEEPNATGISVSANTVVTSIPTLNPQSKLEKFVNWFLQKWDKYKNL